MGGDGGARVAWVGSVMFFVWLLLITPPFALLACLIAPLPPLLRFRIIANWSALAVWGVRVMCGVRYRVVGAENLPARGRTVVFLSRHESAWETIAFQCVLPPQVFVLKRSLLHIPFFGWGLRQMSPIAIDRGAGAAAMRQLLRQGRERLEAGFCVVVFPEGTRMAPGERRKYFSGGAAVAMAAGVPVVPVDVDSGRCWGRNSFFKRRGVITVRVGPTIDVEGLSAAEVTERARGWIEGGGA